MWEVVKFSPGCLSRRDQQRLVLFLAGIHAVFVANMMVSERNLLLGDGPVDEGSEKAASDLAAGAQ